MGTFALGIGATAVVFSLVHSVLLPPLPYRKPDRLAYVQQVIPEIAERVPILGVNPRSFTAWERGCRTTCAGMAAIAPSTTTLTGAGEPVGLLGAKITPALLYSGPGITPTLGRPFTPAEDDSGLARTGWSSSAMHSGKAASLEIELVVGRVLTLDGVAVEIVGVLPATFRLAAAALSPPNRVGDPFEIFRPMAWSDDYRPLSLGRVRQHRDRPAAGRRVGPGHRGGTDGDHPKAEFAAASIHPYAVATPLIDGVTADARRPLWLVRAAVAAALLIACVNVAGLLGTRWTARQRELAIRAATGAGRWRHWRTSSP